MLSLQPHHITDLFVIIDDIVAAEQKLKGGRPLLLSASEVITILLWNTLIVRQKTLKDIHQWFTMYHAKDFPGLHKYNTFVRRCHQALPYMIIVLEQLLAHNTPIRLMDSTMLEVCKLSRADDHKVAKNTAKFGKNHQGWHYGFKLHASVDLKGRLCAISFTGADQHDAQQIPKIVNRYTKIAVGDGGYTARVMREHVWETTGTLIVSPPHYKQNKKLLTWWQYLLLRARPKIECVFDYLKEHLHLISSFPRSVKGYLLHYIRILLGYQFMVV